MDWRVREGKMLEQWLLSEENADWDELYHGGGGVDTSRDSSKRFTSFLVRLPSSKVKYP